MNRQSTLKVQWLTYSQDPAAFVRDCVYIYDATAQDWVKFDLWPAQAETLPTMAASRKLVILKARQLGISWLSLGLCAVADALPGPGHHPALLAARGGVQGTALAAARHVRPAARTTCAPAR